MKVKTKAKIYWWLRDAWHKPQHMMYKSRIKNTLFGGFLYDMFFGKRTSSEIKFNCDSCCNLWYSIGFLFKFWKQAKTKSIVINCFDYDIKTDCSGYAIKRHLDFDRKTLISYTIGSWWDRFIFTKKYFFPFIKAIPKDVKWFLLDYQPFRCAGDNHKGWNRWIWTIDLCEWLEYKARTWEDIDED